MKHIELFSIYLQVQRIIVACRYVYEETITYQKEIYATIYVAFGVSLQNGLPSVLHVLHYGVMK